MKPILTVSRCSGSAIAWAGILHLFKEVLFEGGYVAKGLHVHGRAGVIVVFLEHELGHFIGPHVYGLEKPMDVGILGGDILRRLILCCLLGCLLLRRD